MGKVDVLGALRRMVTLPRGANSLDDVLGHQRAEALKALARDEVELAATHAVRIFADRAAGAAAGIIDMVARAVHVDERTHAELYRTLGAGLESAWQSAVGRSRDEVTAAVVDAANRALGL